MIEKRYIYINKEQVHDTIVSSLYALSILDDDVEVDDVEIKDDENDTDMYELTLYIRSK